MTPTSDQMTGMAERTVSGALIGILGFALHKLVVLGLLADSDVTTLSPLLIILLSAGYAYWVNRPKAIVQSAAALPGTVVVTTPDLSGSTPEKNIVSNTMNRVIDKVTNKIVAQSAEPLAVAPTK